jgi:hypothetical protein
MIINRYFNPINFRRIKDDFKFLLKMIKDKDYRGEFGLALRADYFNLYYKGYRLARKGITNIL